MSGTHPGLVRRDVLRGATVAALGAVLLKDIPAARALLAPGSQQATVPVGVTLDTSVFPRGTSMAAAMAEWAKVTGTAPLSTKVYLGHRQFPGNLGNAKLAWCRDHGATAIICYNPDPGGADTRHLAGSLAALKRAGLAHACVVLWSEPIGTKRHLSPQAYQAGYKKYASAAKSSGWPLYADINGSQQSQWQQYLPAVADGWAVDDYASRGNWQSCFTLANEAFRAGKKFGWFEMGASASHPVTQATVTSYFREVTGFLAGHKGATGPVTWWNGHGMNTIVPRGRGNGTNDYLVGLYSGLYRALAS